MSFDVFCQRFVDGQAAPGGGDAVRAALAPYVVRADPGTRYLFVEYGDGSADVYLGPDDLMANHVAGQDPWDLLVSAARAADWVLMPTDCPTCLTAESQRAHLPEGLDEDVVLVETGADVLRILRHR